VIDSLAGYDLPCIVVDDGSGEATRIELDRIAAATPWVEIVRHPHNRGRGAALRTAYRAASAAGATHVIQVDADGQHAADDVPRFIEAAVREPEALILGTPVFDESVPWHRLHGRKLSQVIVWLETRSREVSDPLCGYRCMPLKSTIEILDTVRTGDRMDFDPEIIIRLVRHGVPVRNIPTRVHYPEGGLSQFRMVKDNLRIAWAYVRLAPTTWRSRPFAGHPKSTGS
jgi:glycosyltransferase involved in cell wall biosynthesis